MKEAQIAALQGKLNVAYPTVDGMEAQLVEMKQAHKDSPHLQDTGLRYQSGNKKTKLSFVFEKAFDAILRQIGVVCPEAYRAP